MSGPVRCGLVARRYKDELVVEMTRNDLVAAKGVLSVGDPAVATLECQTKSMQWTPTFAVDCAKVVDTMERYNRNMGVKMILVVVGDGCASALPLMRRMGYVESEAAGVNNGAPWLYRKTDAK
jgi:hypothetical protein